MKALRIPIGVWNWRGTALVLALLLAPLLVALTLVPDGDVLTTASNARGLVVGMGTLSAGAFLYIYWRITANDTAGWLALLLSFAAVPGLALGAFALAGQDVAAQSGWLFAFRVAVLGGMLAIVLSSRSVSLRGDPMAIGLLAGLVFAGVRHLVLVQAPALPTPPGFSVFPVAVLGGLAIALAVAVYRLDELPRWLRARIALGVLLLVVGSTLGGLVGLPTGVVGAVLLAGTTAAVLHQAIDEEKREVDDLHVRLQAFETGLRKDRARLHEINATVAGIASAQRLMADGLTSDRSEALASMMRAEVERLQRLVGDRGPTRRRSVDLDEVIGQIVLSHLARGRLVIWEPSGVRALGRADEIAEVVNVLLENAAVHGGPDAVSVRATHDPDGPGVTVVVSDQGPGVPAQLRDRVFDWGVSRPDSPGQGIGLHVAADIARQLDGRLELVSTPTGATFALHLPAAAQGVSKSEPVAAAS